MVLSEIAILCHSTQMLVYFTKSAAVHYQQSKVSGDMNVS